MGLIAGGAGVIVLALVVGGVLFMRRPGGSSQGKPPGGGPGVIQIETRPSGASVSVNGEAKGTAPVLVKDLAAGRYELKAELAGYTSKTETVQITADQPKAEVKLTLDSAQGGSGVADIMSLPSGAAVLVDGVKVGETPLLGFKLSVGSHKVEMTKAGREPWSADVTIEPGRKTKVNVALQAGSGGSGGAARTPTTKPETDTNKVYLDNEVDTKPTKLSGEAYQPTLKPGESPAVTLSWVVTEKGDVTDVQVVQSSGGKSLDEAAAAAIKKWKYAPAQKNGVNVRMKMFVKQVFKHS